MKITSASRQHMRLYIMRVRRQKLALCIDAKRVKDKMVTYPRVKGTENSCSPVLYWSIK